MMLSIPSIFFSVVGAILLVRHLETKRARNKILSTVKFLEKNFPKEGMMAILKAKANISQKMPKILEYNEIPNALTAEFRKRTDKKPFLYFIYKHFFLFNPEDTRVLFMSYAMIEDLIPQWLDVLIAEILETVKFTEDNG